MNLLQIAPEKPGVIQSLPSYDPSPCIYTCRVLVFKVTLCLENLYDALNARQHSWFMPPKSHAHGYVGQTHTPHVLHV